MQLLSEHAVRNQEVGYSNPLALLPFPVNRFGKGFLRLRVWKIDFVLLLPYSFNKSCWIWQWGMNITPFGRSFSVSVIRSLRASRAAGHSRLGTSVAIEMISSLRDGSPETKVSNSFSHRFLTSRKDVRPLTP